MAESILSIQQGASRQIGLCQPLCVDETQLMDIKASVPKGCDRKKSSLRWLTAYALPVRTEVSRLVLLLARHAPSCIYIF
jgi:hypothetical protein